MTPQIQLQRCGISTREHRRLFSARHAALSMHNNAAFINQFIAQTFELASWLLKASNSREVVVLC
jgi:hypothetical protein